VKKLNRKILYLFFPLFAIAVLYSLGIVAAHEGIELSQRNDTVQVGTTQTITATVNDANHKPMSGVIVNFEIISGPHTGLKSFNSTGSSGNAAFTFNGTSEGTDTVKATFKNSEGETITKTLTMKWIANPVPELSGAAVLIILATTSGLAVLVNKKRK
jgi:hypothetical protein